MKCKFYVFLFALVASICFSQAAIIEIDGTFSDWDAISGDRLALASIDESSLLKDLYSIKFCTDEGNVYFYIEFNGDTYNYGDQQVGNVVEYFDLFFSIDDDATTGFYDQKWGWTDCGADFLVESTLDGKGFSAFFFGNDWGAHNEWNWGWIQDCNITASERVILANSHMALEGKIDKTLFSSEVKNLKVGVFTHNTEWKGENGCLPQMSLIENDTILSGMLNVPLVSQSITKEYTVTYVSDNIDIESENITLHLPIAPEIEGFTFLKWAVSATDLEEGITIHAVYMANVPDTVPAVVVNPANRAQKLIREGNVYILTDTKTYTIQGQEVK